MEEPSRDCTSIERQSISKNHDSNRVQSIVIANEEKSNLDKYDKLNISMDSLNNSSSTSSTSSLQKAGLDGLKLTEIESVKTASLNSCNNNELSSSPPSETTNQDEEARDSDETYDSFDTDKLVERVVTTNLVSATTIKRTHLINLIFELYDLTRFNNDNDDENERNESMNGLVIESFMEKLPPGKTLSNSLLLAWRRRYFTLSSMGNLIVYDIDEKTGAPKLNRPPVDNFNIMGGRVEYDEAAKVISLDDSRGNCVVFRCCAGTNDSDELYAKWKEAVEAQIIDRSELLWCRPNRPLTNSRSINKKVLIVDIGTCSIRAGLFENEPRMPRLFAPTVCSKAFSPNGKLKAGFDAFDFLLGSSAPSTIDLRKSLSSWSLNSTNSSSQLVFPFRNKNAIDKLNFDIEGIDAIITHVVENMNIEPQEHEIVVVTTHRLTDKVNVQFLNLLLGQDSFNFRSATIINQSLLGLYFYNTNVGIVANLGEKIDIVPICNGVAFQGGVTNLAYGGSTMSEYLNGFISRGHVNYVNDIEQYFVRYVKEKSCYAALDYKEELKKYPNDTTKYVMELRGRSNEFKKVEFPESARFKAVEGLFNPEIWGIDGQGLHKLIHKAIQSTSMDLRKEMAQNILLCGGMSQIPGLPERLEKELKPLFPPTVKIKINCSPFSYHCAYLGAFRFIQQPEYEKLMITQDEWIKENVGCLRKWRMM